jgi:hypothetical protein
MLTIAFIFKLLGLIVGCIGAGAGLLLVFAWIHDRWARRGARDETIIWRLRIR